MSKPRPHRWLRAGFNIALIAGLLTAVSFLPPDTSLRDRERAGVLKACVPPSYAPLVTGDPARPGYDIELLNAVAEHLKLRLQVNVLSSIGIDFNPRNWLLTRAQCDVVAGGVADTDQTRSFLQTIPTDAETGWVGISREGTLPAAGASVAVLPGTTGLDRLALSSWLRKEGLVVVPARNVGQLRQILQDGTVTAGLTERFAAGELGLAGEGFELFWLPEQNFPHYRMALGLWKGDQTLRRGIVAALDALRQAGELARLAERYGLDDAITIAPGVTSD